MDIPHEHTRDDEPPPRASTVCSAASASSMDIPHERTPAYVPAAPGATAQRAYTQCIKFKPGEMPGPSAAPKRMPGQSAGRKRRRFYDLTDYVPEDKFKGPEEFILRPEAGPVWSALALFRGQSLVDKAVAFEGFVNLCRQRSPEVPFPGIHESIMKAKSWFLNYEDSDMD